MKYQVIYTRTYTLQEELEADSRAEAEMLAEIRYGELTSLDFDEANGKWEIDPHLKVIGVLKYEREEWEPVLPPMPAPPE